MDPCLPLPILIKGEEKFLDGPEIIDLDEQVSSEDIILEWCTRVRLKFKSFFVADTERNLDTLMKWYIQFFKEEAMHIDDCSALKVAVTKHLQFFKMVFTELDCPFVDNYLDNMEDILALYCDLEANDLPKKQKGSSYGSTLKIIGRKLINSFNFFLMNKEERVHHVLMKMRLNSSEESTDLLNFLYGKLLTKGPTRHKSDLAFCRTYILYQKWKTIQKPDLWKQMDMIMYEQFDRTPESLKTNETLNQILFPRNESVLNVLTHISNNYTMMSEEYFKFLRSQNIQEDSLVPLDVINVDSDESRDGDHEDFDRAYDDYVASLAASEPREGGGREDAAPERPDAAPDDDDDECIIVGVGTIDFGQSNSDLVCDISDDEDIIDIVFFQPKQEPPREIRKETPAAAPPPPSFLDSIDISSPTPAPPPAPASPIVFTVVTPPPSKGSLSSPSEVDSPAPCRPRAKRRPAARRRVERTPGAALKQRAARRRAARKRFSLGSRTLAVERDEQMQKTNLDAESTKKIVNHIETQTDFPLSTVEEAAEEDEAEDARTDAEEEVFERGGLVTPPASEHRRDADQVVAAETNVYAAILVSDSSPSSSDVAPAPGHRSGDYYASPDVSSTSHDHPHDAKGGAVEEEGAAAAEAAEEGSPPPVAPPEFAEVCDGVTRLPVVAPAKWTYRDFDKFQEELNACSKKSAGAGAGVVHSKWDTLIENHGLEDDFLSGSIEKVNGCVNPYKDFDLFDDRPPAPAEEPAPAASPEPRGVLNDSTSQTSSSGIPSPPYEGMCDFQNYLTSYEAASGAATERFKAPKSILRRAKSDWTDPKVDKPKTPGKKTLAFDLCHPPQLHGRRADPSSAVQGILKKPTRRAPRASRRLVSEASLRHHRVSADDPCLRAEPVVVVERIGQSEIRRWETISAISRKVRQQRERTRHSLTTSLCRVDYDKSTMSLNENDRIQYNTQEAAAAAGASYDAVELEGDLPYTDRKNGKRKRKGNPNPKLPYVTAVPKKRGEKSDSLLEHRKAIESSEKTQQTMRRTSERVRIVPDKDYDSLVTWPVDMPREISTRITVSACDATRREIRPV